MRFNCFLQNRQASVAPMLALAAMPLFGAVGAAVDYSRAASARAEMQAALDASALLMAKDAKNVDDAQLNAGASNYFNASFQNSEVENIQTTVAISSTSGGYLVSMSATGWVSTKFMGIMGYSTLKVAVNSKAISYMDGLGCVLSLNKHVSGAATGQGSTSVTLSGCSLYDNSDHATALVAGGSAHISALSVGVVGNVSGASNISTTLGIRTGIGAVVDPYAEVANPTPTGSIYNYPSPINNSITLNPGIYPSGLKLVAGASVTLSPGTYYIQGNGLNVQGGATLTGNGVTLVFTSSNGSDYATATINGNATVNLTPPTIGPTAGIVIFGDRNMPAGTSFKFNGGATQYLGGAVYLSKGAINFAGGANTSTSCTQLIGDTVTFTGNSAFALNCSSYGTKPFSPLIVKLIS
jgi:Flp pilus assembly protein TadG